VRVLVATAGDELAAGLNPAPESNFGGIPEPASSGSPVILERKVAVRAALKAGLLGVLLSMIPFLGIVLTGVLAVFFYHRADGVPLSGRLGTRLGSAAGVIAFAISAPLTVVRMLLFQKESQDDILRIFQSFGLDPADPAIQTSIHRLFTPAGLAMSLFFWMIITLALAALGGAIASALKVGRRER
jgi:hypothetical protein